jgi:hypothetical protein
MPRKEAAALIDSTANARFYPEVTFETNYLVAAIFDSGKARKAAKIGVSIINEAEMMECVKIGRFPDNKTPQRPPHVNNFPEIVWSKKFSPAVTYYVEYEEGNGVVTQRYISVTCEGRATNGNDYVGAYDGEWFKTFRRDRFRRIQPI